MKKAILKQTKKPDITLDIFDEQAGIMKKVTFIGPAIDAYKKPSLSEEELEIVRKYESALKLKAHMDKLKEYREADSKIPDHLKNVLSGDDLSDMEKTAMTKPLSMEDKKNAAKSFKKIGIANDLWDDDWTDLKARLPAMDYVQQHKELSRLLNLIQAHKNAYQLKGVYKVNEAENEITYIINDIQCAHPELSQKGNSQSKQKTTKTDKNHDATQTLKKRFINKQAFTEAIEALQEVNTPVIDRNMNYLLGTRQKSAFTAWFDVLKLRGKLLKTDASTMAKLLNQTIKGLNISNDGKTLRTPKKTVYRATAYSKYYSAFLKKISS